MGTTSRATNAGDVGDRGSGSRIETPVRQAMPASTRVKIGAKASTHADWTPAAQNSMRPKTPNPNPRAGPMSAADRHAADVRPSAQPAKLTPAIEIQATASKSTQSSRCGRTISSSTRRAGSNTAKAAQDAESDTDHHSRVPGMGARAWDLAGRV